MLFGFYILVFLNINYAKIECFTVKQNEPATEINITNKSRAINTAEFITNNATTNYFFKTIQNLTSNKTKRSNLKSNVFDKMLSDEMLSLKNHFFKKDLTQISIMIPTNADASTPTLQIKQKWPFEEYDLVEHNESNSTDEIKDDFNNENNIGDVKTKDNETVNEQSIQNLNEKIVGLRSLSADAHPHAAFHRAHTKDILRNASYTTGVTNGALRQKSCTCTKINNPSAGCNHQGDNACKCGGNMPKGCTRPAHNAIPTAAPLYSYITYQTYLLEISTYSPYRDYYYHPNILDNIKLPKKHKKHKHKTTKRIDEESLYYDNSKEGFFKGYDDKYSDEDYLEHVDEKPSKNKHIDKIVIDIDYEVRDDKGKKSKSTIKWENAYITDVKKDKLVNDMVKDLRRQYSDAVLKDCYCSAFSAYLNVKLFLLPAIALFCYFDY